MAYTTTRICMYRTTLDEGVDAALLVERVKAAGVRVMQHNEKVMAVDAYVDAGGLVTHMEFKHRDQWWIRRKAPHVAVAILVQGGVDISRTKLVDIVKPRDVPPRP